MEGLERVIELDAGIANCSARSRTSSGAQQGQQGHRKDSSRAAGLGDRHAKRIGEKAEALEPELEQVSAELEEAASYLPNLPHESVPDGLTENDNVVERTPVRKPEFDFEPKEHVTLGEILGIFDSDRAAKTSGSRFVYLTGPGVILELALVRFAIDYLIEHRFTPVIPPVLVRRHAMYGTGFLPAEEHEFYVIERDELF